MDTQTNVLPNRPISTNEGNNKNLNHNGQRNNRPYRTQRRPGSSRGHQSNNSKLKIIPLGGVEEIGINSTVYEYKNEIVVVDLGLGFSDQEYYGIDAVVPNIGYLMKNKSKIKGVLITHGHLDHIGGIQYLIEQLDFPKIYGSHFTIELIRAKLSEYPELISRIGDKLTIVNTETKLKLGNFDFEFVHLNHSIPQCLGILIKAGDTKVFHTGDFKFDNSPINEPVGDYAKLADFGKQGIDLLLSDSTNSLKKGHPISESEVAFNLGEIIERAQGRIIVATFAGLVGRLYQLIEIAKKYKKKVLVAGYSMNQTLTLANEIGYIRIPPNLLISPREAERYKGSNLLILSTGAQGEPNAALPKMVNADYKGIKIQKGDTVIISAKTIPGNDKAVQTLVDSITAKGAKVQQIEDLDLFTSGHGYQEDQKIMLNLIKPKFFMPVHGYQYFLRAHGETAKKVGVDEKNIIIAKRGSIIEGSHDSEFKIVKTFPCEPLIVSGSGVGDVGESVLKEREQLANYGIVILSLVLDKDKNLIRNPFVLTRGFVYAKSNQEILTQLSLIAKAIYDENKTRESQEIKDEINKAVSDYVFNEIGREPMIMTILNY